MGYLLFDQYSYLHFACGIIAYFWKISSLNLLYLHSIFEIIENTPYGIHFINYYLTLWPGGKPSSDTSLNMIGDTISVLIGWYTAQYIDYFGLKYNLYKPHLQ